MHRIGFLCSTSTQVQTFIPIMESMKGDSYEFLWICLDNYSQSDAGKALEHSQIDFDLFGEYHGRRFSNLSLPEMYRAVQTNIVPQILDFFSRNQLDVLVVGNDRGLIEKQFIRLAKTYGIKTLLVQDGILWTNEVRHWKKNARIDSSLKAYSRDILKESLNRTLSTVGLSHLAPTYVGQGDCDAIAAMGQSTKRVLAQRGVDVDRICVTGQPRYDRVLQIKQSRAEIKRRLGLPDCPIIAVFTSAYGTNLHSRVLQSQQERFVNELGRQVNQAGTGNVLLLFKPHPRESLSNYDVPSDDGSVRIIKDSSSIDVIAVSDVVVSVPSTIIVEACLFRKPLFVLNLGSGQKQQVASSLGLSSGAFQELQVGKDSQQFLDPTIWDDLLNASTQDLGSVCNDLVYVPEEGAAIQVANLLAKLVAKV